MKILFSTAEVTTLIVNYTELSSAAEAVETKELEENGEVANPDTVKVKKDKLAKVMTFLSTEGSEYKEGPMTITKVKNGVGVTIDEGYVTEFTEIYLTSIIPMLKPMAEVIKASKKMAEGLKALEAKFQTSKSAE